MADTRTNLNSLYGDEAKILRQLIEWGNNIDIDYTYPPYDTSPFEAAPSDGKYTSETSGTTYTCATWAILLPQLQVVIASNIIDATSINTKVDNSTAESIAGVKTFSSSPIVPTATTATQVTNYGQVVKNTGNETVAGVKTFSSKPILSPLTASRAVQTSASKELESSTVTSTELGYVSGVTSAIQDQLDDALSELPFCALSLSSDQTSGNTIAWNNEDEDLYNMHDNSTNPTRITIPAGQGGLYSINACITVLEASATDAIRGIQIRNNGILVKYTNTYVFNNKYTSLQINYCKRLSAGDYIEIRTDATLTAFFYVTGNTAVTWLSVKRIR